jgi:4a-hydroxytetrahydrobiopterin dehydratase
MSTVVDSEVKLTGDERAKQLAEISSEWSEVQQRDAIERKLAFKDFKQAWAFMNKVADVADEADHHPEWFNVYNRVDITLSTHVCQGLSMRDIRLAKRIDEFAQEFE